jgi:tagatose 6-phosphate kinase
VVASAGSDGAFVIPVAGEPLRGWLEKPLRGNPTGAGDAMVAGVAAGLQAGLDWAAVLAAGIAWSAAAVLQPVAGEVSKADIAELLPLVRSQPLGG